MVALGVPRDGAAPGVEHAAPAGPPARPSGPPAAASPGNGNAPGRVEVNWTDDGSVEGKWQINCNQHGWHPAKPWAARGNLPAVVKCSKRTGEKQFCTTAVPYEVALAQVQGRA